jgi:protein TonB
MIGRSRALAVLGSTALHVGAVVAVLALATSLRQPQPLFVDLTGASRGDEERAAHAVEPRGGTPAISRAREARRAISRAPRAPDPSAPERPTETAPARVPPFSASREVAPADRAIPPPAADMPAAETHAPDMPVAETKAGGVKGVSGDMPAHADQSHGAAGGGGSLLALAGPGSARAEVPAEFGPYLARFRQRIQESVVYPLAARRRGLAGRVEVELLLEPSGRIRDVAVVSSSSHALLDEAAVEAVRSLEPQPLPEHPKRQTLRVRLPVVFQLR